MLLFSHGAESFVVTEVRHRGKAVVHFACGNQKASAYSLALVPVVYEIAGSVHQLLQQQGQIRYQ